MNPRQGVLISMFVSVAIFLLANAQASVINKRVADLKQTPSVPVTPPRNVGGGGTSGGGTGGAGGGF